MVAYVPYSKLDKINKNIFTTMAISRGDEFKETDIENFNMIAPPIDLYANYFNDSISKKKFLKKYKKFLKKIKGSDSIYEQTFCAIGKILIKDKSNLCITCDDKEFKSGYLKVLAEFIVSIFGSVTIDANEAKVHSKEILVTLDKKDRKLLTKDASELSEKQLKKRSKFVKNLNKENADDTPTGDMVDYYDHILNRFAIENLTILLVAADVVKIKSDFSGFENIDYTKVPATKHFAKAIFNVAKSSKKMKKIVKSIFDSHGIKFNKGVCAKMESNVIVPLFGEVYAAIAKTYNMN